MTNPLDTQIGGGHYKQNAIQPMEFSMRNHWDAAAHTALKYLSRFKDKAGRQDLEKAHHCLHLRDALFDPVHVFPVVIPMAEYVAANGYQGLQAVALFNLAEYVFHGDRQAMEEVEASVLALIAAEYPDG